MSMLRNRIGSPLNPSACNSESAEAVSFQAFGDFLDVEMGRAAEDGLTRSTLQLAASAPKAELSPGCGGMSIRVMPSRRAQALA